MPFTIACGWRPGLLGRTTELHARYYAQAFGFGPRFEAVVAGGLAEFVPRLRDTRNQIWAALDGETVIGTIAIDGQDMAPAAHLRWFILHEAAQGTGIGRALLQAALAHVDAQGFAETRLWTFAGLNPARRLYERHGFAMADERPGDQWGEPVMEQLFIRPRAS
ncbi:GNAT family N-acetyltransferase [Plastoroseomonas arctica]|uniref:GNAT family N-acetyltransferase n=1 Tax=Plastoroseomonas arctica TaxID=1509237 RepID=A0AAF1KQ60_9PROT|nr:GNAT family N-acetyltransferase [Plastoroseomonas arctica]MBR0653472.1 GNAT family N-acetyltransferase [Plastoroseomonas arctica]